MRVSLAHLFLRLNEHARYLASVESEVSEARVLKRRLEAALLKQRPRESAALGFGSAAHHVSTCESLAIAVEWIGCRQQTDQFLVCARWRQSIKEAWAGLRRVLELSFGNAASRVHACEQHHFPELWVPQASIREGPQAMCAQWALDHGRTLAALIH
jgi:hypothetical protein